MEGRPTVETILVDSSKPTQSEIEISSSKAKYE